MYFEALVAPSELVEDCIDFEQTPFSQATLARFRTTLIIQGFDRRLIERTVELAEQSKGLRLLCKHNR